MCSKINKVVVIGCVYPDALRKELISRGAYLDMAGHTFGNSIITGLYEQGINYTMISSPFIRWSRKHLVYVTGCRFKSQENKQSQDVCIGNLNIPLIGKLFEFCQVRRQLRNELKSDKDASVIILSLHSPYLLAYFTLWRTHRKSCVTVCDLPQYMSGNQSFTYRFAKAIDRILIDFCLKKIDSYVLLSPYMAHDLPIGNKRWITVEGVFNSSISFPNRILNREVKTILYTGGISQRYGVFDLIEAFVRIPNKDYRLCLCGGCDDIALINKYLQQDNRITYLGLVDKEKIIELQSNATLLVNPRHSHEEFTKYSFPSKTMEYLASGTPTVMCDLQCLPKEYKQYLFIFDDESIDGYSQKLVEICSKDSETLLEFGRRAAQFIRTQKNEIVQTRKILDLLYSD